jgi:gas vesicle protein
VSKKVDSDLLKHTQQQLKTDLQHEIAICKGDLSHELHGKDTKFQERLEKTEINSDRALDEIYQYKEVIRSLQEERKRDIEETADFVKQLMDNFKDDLQRDVYQFKDDIEKLKKDMIDRTTVQEML